MKRALFTFGCLFLASQAASQAPSPAQLGITPTTNPEALQVLDSTKTWVPLGAVHPDSHTFVPVGGGGGGGGSEADILVTDPTVGMAAVTAVSVPDNASHISALMAKMGPANPFISGYDVTFPSVPGQNYTEYYFSQPLLLTRGANYHCSGTSVNSGTYLIFAPGIDGIIQEAYNMTPDGGAGKGKFSGCTVLSMGFGVATSNPITPNTLTAVSFQRDPANLIPFPTWSVGDGIILNALNGFFPSDAIPSAPIGTTVTAVAGTTLTLSNPVSSFLGAKGNPPSTALFTQTGTNNFVSNDTITVGVGPGSTTYKFTTTVGVNANNVLIGSNFAASAANLVSAIMGTAGQFVTYIPPTTGPGGYAANQQVKASYASGVITFTSIYSGPAVNTFVSTYTPAGTAAGSFGGATFTGGNDAVSCPAPCTVQNVSQWFYQLPATQAFKIQTTIGGNSITVISGPRLLKSSDVVWSAAFPYGSTVGTVTGTAFPQTVTILTPIMTAVQNATVTYAPGAEGNLWTLPEGLKRRAVASAEFNNFSHWPIGLGMVCASGYGAVICTGSSDKGNWYQQDMVGRWVAGNNTSASSSYDEKFSSNFLVDIFEGATLGEVYVNPNSNSPESGSAKWGTIANCNNLNDSIIVGGYLYGSGNSCADQTKIYPPVPGGPFIIGPQANIPNGPSMFGTTSTINFRSIPGFFFLGGNDGKMCAKLGGVPAGQSPLFTIGNNTCAGPDGFTLGFNSVLNSFDWNYSNVATVMRLVNTSALGYTGYAGSGSGVAFPGGVILGGDGNALPANARVMCMTPALPTATWHKQGDLCFNTAPAHGSPMGWVDLSDGANFIPLANVP